MPESTPPGARGGENVFRRVCKWLIQQAWFDNIILLMIVVNCSILAVQTPTSGPAVLCVLPGASLEAAYDEEHHNCGPDKTCEQCQQEGDCSCNGPLQPGFANRNLGSAVELGFTIAFSVEALARITATGFIWSRPGELAYLRYSSLTITRACARTCKALTLFASGWAGTGWTGSSLS